MSGARLAEDTALYELLIASLDGTVGVGCRGETLGHVDALSALDAVDIVGDLCGIDCYPAVVERYGLPCQMHFSVLFSACYRRFRSGSGLAHADPCGKQGLHTLAMLIVGGHDIVHLSLLVHDVIE